MPESKNLLAHLCYTRSLSSCPISTALRKVSGGHRLDEGRATVEELRGKVLDRIY
jgi:hypothetical protein